MKRCKSVGYVILLGTLIVAGRLSGEPPATDDLHGYWEKLPYPPDSGPLVNDIGLEPGGVLWVMGSGGMTYWDGQQYHVPQGPEMKTGSYLTRFYGGPDRGLYATQMGDEETQGKLYRLSDDPGEREDVIDRYPAALAQLAERMESMMAVLKLGAPDSLMEAPLDEETRRSLKSLGYIK